MRSFIQQEQRSGSMLQAITYSRRRLVALAIILAVVQGTRVNPCLNSTSPRFGCRPFTDARDVTDAATDYYTDDGNDVPYAQPRPSANMSSVSCIFLGCALTSDDADDMQSCFEEVGRDKVFEIVILQPEPYALKEGTFSGLSNLRTMRLGGRGGLASLAPGIFSELKSLELLRLRGSRLTSLSLGVFAGLGQLKYLAISDTALTTLPQDIFSPLANLTNLRFRRNQVTSLPEGCLNGLTALTHLTFDEPKLTALTKRTFSGLPALQALGFLNIQDAEFSPGCFSALENLTQLLFMQSRFTWPGGMLSGLKSLKVLILTGDALSTLPDDMASHVPNLHTLILTANIFSSWPEQALSGFKHLRRLEMSDNQLKSCPGDLWGLTWLDMSRNQLKMLPDDCFSGVPNLQGLSLRNNDLTVLPTALFSNLNKLDYINLSNNKDLECIPIITNEVHLRARNTGTATASNASCGCEIEGVELCGEPGQSCIPGHTGYSCNASLGEHVARGF